MRYRALLAAFLLATAPLTALAQSAEDLKNDEKTAGDLLNDK